jgi:hypothetical protein
LPAPLIFAFQVAQLYPQNGGLQFMRLCSSRMVIFVTKLMGGRLPVLEQ